MAQRVKTNNGRSRSIAKRSLLSRPSDDTNKPDGMSRKLLDSQRINYLGWKPEVSLKDGLVKAYEDFRKKI